MINEQIHFPASLGVGCIFCKSSIVGDSLHQVLEAGIISIFSNGADF